jgi:hypothetical protein
MAEDISGARLAEIFKNGCFNGWWWIGHRLSFQKELIMANDGSSTPSSPTDDNARGTIAHLVLKFGIISLIIVSVIVIIVGLFVLLKEHNVDKSTSMIEAVFHALLPVVATWVGTVIAFYFGKANFEAASKSASDLARQFANTDDKLRATKVTDPGVMIPLAEIAFNKTLVAKTDAQILVEQDLIKFIDSIDKGDRLPVLDSKNAVRYIIHESTLNECARKLAAGNYSALAKESLSKVTLDEMVKKTDQEMGSKLTYSASFVSKNATLFEAKTKMDSNQFSQDVFVTATGGRAEPIIGWITNNRISDLSRV